MSELELETSGYQVEVIGEPSPLGRKLVVNGHDISKVTQAVRIEVPANGFVEAHITVAPTSLSAKAEVEVDRIRLWIEGIGSLLSLAEDAANRFALDGEHEAARQLRAAIRKVEMGI